MKKILISQCVYGGDPVRFDGQSKESSDATILKWKEEGRLIPVCPEVLGGLPVPRAETQIKDGHAIGIDGRDVTEEFTRGAEEVLKIAEDNDVAFCIMRDRSPSCGVNIIYDGTFSGKRIPGQGLTTKLLKEAGFKVISENEVNSLEILSDTD